MIKQKKSKVSLAPAKNSLFLSQISAYTVPGIMK